MTRHAGAMSSLATLVEDYVRDTGIEHEPGAREGEVVVTLPGEHKLKTVVSLVAGQRTLSVSAFVIRSADERHEEFYRFLLRRNLKLPGIAYAIDSSGDVYVRGVLPAAGLDAEQLDRLLGAVLDAADGPFNELLAIGFLSSMVKEWRWRIERGESLRNLAAFAALLERESGVPAPEGALD